MTATNRSLDPLMALLQQAERERDAALADVQKLVDANRAAEMQLEQLVNYRTEYEARFREQFKSHQGIAALQGYQVFSERLTLAIDQQGRAVQHAEARVVQSRQVLIEQEMRVASVRKLLERRLNEIKLGSERREQRQTDEFATRAAWARLAHPSGFMPAL
jgi:flagellar protein FliJ